ncbi:MAG: FAD-dependent oxidoreductase [Halobacteriales archaeon]|nr:FAD-dependent oxidoreductase [Halobacteriales archaeon]
MSTVAVFGAGYAGVTTARRLESLLPTDVDLIVVERSGTHLVQHELHRVIRRPSFEDDITVPLEELFEHASIRQATVESIDPEDRQATFDDGSTLSYDYGAVCLGAETAYYDLPGVETHATPLKSLADAHTIRADFLDVLETGGRVVIGGAGLSGIQVAGELAALARQEAAADRVTIELVERLESVAPGFPANFRTAVAEELRERDIVLRTDTAVEAATDSVLETDAGEIPYDQLLWTGGITGPMALGGDRPRVNSTLQLADGTFVVGDAARVVDRDGEAVPASAQAAVREARTAATNIARLVDHDRSEDDLFEPRLEPYSFDDLGWIVSVGNGAVAQVGPTVVRGTAALALKTTVGVGHLTSVGAVRNAVELAREEFSGALGLPMDAVDDLDTGKAEGVDGTQDGPEQEQQHDDR